VSEPVDDLRPALAVLSASSAAESVKPLAFPSPARRERASLFPATSRRQHPFGASMSDTMSDTGSVLEAGMVCFSSLFHCASAVPAVTFVLHTSNHRPATVAKIFAARFRSPAFRVFFTSPEAAPSASSFRDSSRGSRAFSRLTSGCLSKASRLFSRRYLNRHSLPPSNRRAGWSAGLAFPIVVSVRSMGLSFLAGISPTCSFVPPGYQ
jgi:hypothetical protein